MFPMPLRPEYSTLTFQQVYNSYEQFKEDFDFYFPLLNALNSSMNVKDVKATFYYLYAKYGNNPIVNFDVTQFKMKLFGVMSAYGPTWARKRKIQDDLRDLTESQLLQGAKQIYNHAFNPSTAPSTTELEEMTHINDQNVTNNKKSYMEAYAILWANLHVDATDEYMNKFKNCFSRFVGDECPILFVVEDD